MSENELCYETLPEHIPNIIRDVYAMSPALTEFAEYHIPGPIPEIMVDAILNQYKPWGIAHHSAVISMSTILGRNCKFSIFTVNGRFFFTKKWIDHPPSKCDALALMYGVFDDCTA